MTRLDKFLARLGVRTPDEMEKHILFRAQRNAYWFLIAALVCATFYESYKTLTQHTMLNPMPCFLLIIALWIQIFTQLILQRRAVKDDNESFEPKPYRKLLLLIIAVSAVSMAIAASVAMAGIMR